MRYSIIYFFVLIIFQVSCKSDTKVEATPTAAPTTAAATTPSYPAVPNDLMMSLWNECDLIDYIFHNLPFSMNQSQQASIRTNLTYISSTPQGSIPPTCKAMGRQFYGIAGNIVMEADIYYDQNCMFYVFFVDGKAMYANQMSDTGKQFFQTMIAKGLNAQKGRSQ